MMLTEIFQPLLEYSFMQRAVLGAILVAISAPLLGVFLVLRRMSLAADSLAHAVFPGVAMGFIIYGPSLIAMSIGGFIAGLIVALITGVISRTSIIREDACLVSLYVIAISLGIVLLSYNKTNIDIMGLLFGSILALDNAALYMLGSVSITTIAFLMCFYRILIMDSFDPMYIRSFSNWGGVAHVTFLVVVMLNLVAGLQTMGALLAVGTMMLPAITALIWTKKLKYIAVIAVSACVISNISGILVSYHYNLPAGPSMVLANAVLYISSLLFSQIRHSK